MPDRINVVQQKRDNQITESSPATTATTNNLPIGFSSTSNHLFESSESSNSSNQFSSTTTTDSIKTTSPVPVKSTKTTSAPIESNKATTDFESLSTMATSSAQVFVTASEPIVPTEVTQRPTTQVYSLATGRTTINVTRSEQTQSVSTQNNDHDDGRSLSTPTTAAAYPSSISQHYEISGSTTTRLASATTWSSGDMDWTPNTTAQSDTSPPATTTGPKSLDDLNFLYRKRDSFKRSAFGQHRYSIQSVQVHAYFLRLGFSMGLEIIVRG